MFSALKQGNLLNILDTNKIPTLYKGVIINATEPKIDYGTSFSTGGQAQTYMDITVKVDDIDKTFEFKHIPSNLSMVHYDNGKMIISETPEGLINEVQSIHHNHKHIVDNIDFYNDSIKACEDLLVKLSPQFAKDKEYENKFKDIDNKFNGIEDKLDKVLGILAKQ